MSDLDPAELSAFLDGELDPIRAKEIERLIAADPKLRAEFDRLKLADRWLRSIADTATFRPEIHRAKPRMRRAEAWLALPLVVILVVWTVGKLVPAMPMAVLINAAAFLLFIAFLAPFALSDLKGDSL